MMTGNYHGVAGLGGAGRGRARQGKDEKSNYGGIQK